MELKQELKLIADLEDLENYENVGILHQFIEIFNYSNMFGYEGSMEMAIEDIKNFLDKQLKDFKG